jgi:ubiquinone biosynthesis accessory factor UbiJ
MIERALDLLLARAISDSPRARELIAALEGHRITLQIQGTPWAPTLESNGAGLRTVSLEPGERADALVSGAPLSLLALSGAEAQAVIQRGDVRIEGDVEIAQQFRELAVLLKPELETLLSGPLGRSGAHVLTRGLRGAAAWTRASLWTGVQNLSEFLAHESGDLVSRSEAEHVLRGVDELREQLDRVEARTAQLELKTGKFPGGGGPA